MKVTLLLAGLALLILILFISCEKSTGPKKDTTPPAAITDLRIVTDTETPVTLAWTAPGDDGNKGTATWYYIRYSTDSSIVAEWDFAPCLLDKPKPRPAGTPEEFLLSNLSPDSNYYLAIKSQDDAGNLSRLSNIASGSPIAGGGICFVSGWTIFVVNSDGSHLKKVSPRATAWDPAWCHDRKMVFVSSQEGGSDVYLLDSDGWSQQRLTFKTSWYCAFPVFSPDGSRIAFLVMDYAPQRDSYCDIYVMYSDGSYPKNLTEKSGPRDVEPTWSPDGRKILFVSGRDSNFEIYVMNWDGTNQCRLTDNDGPDLSPVWSPDGTQILYISGPNYPLCSVWTMNSDGTGQRRLTQDEASVCAVWSPCGTRIAYESDGDIYVVYRDGSNNHRLTSHEAYDGQPVWSPDGTKIAFVTERDGNQEIYVMNSDGTNKQNVTNSGGNDRSPAWSGAPAPRGYYHWDPFVRRFPERRQGSADERFTYPIKR